jgi:hypothetical protein
MVEVGKCDDSLYYSANLEKIASYNKLPCNRTLNCALDQIFASFLLKNNPLVNIDSLDIAFNRTLAERVLQVLNSHFFKNSEQYIFNVEDKNTCIDVIFDLLWKVKKTVLPDDKSSEKTNFYLKSKSSSSKRWQKRVFKILSEDPSTPHFFSLMFHQETELGFD